LLKCIFSSPESSKSPFPFNSTTTNSYQSTSSEPSSNRSYLHLNKSPIHTSTSNQSTPRSTPKSPTSPLTADSIKRSFFRFNSASSSPGTTHSSSGNTLFNSNPIMGQTGSNVKRSQSDIQTFLDKEKEKFIDKIENPIKQNALLEDFDLIRTIGTGSFGKNQIKLISYTSYSHRTSTFGYTSR
jgi:hypothetical protein